VAHRDGATVDGDVIVRTTAQLHGLAIQLKAIGLWSLVRNGNDNTWHDEDTVVSRDL
jgi:hypothetical protein